MIRPVIAVLSTAAVVFAVGATHAQTPSHSAASLYAGQEQRAIKALSADEIRDLAEGRGMGLAKAAELNGYPGPLHVLELAAQLGLDAAQRSATETLRASMSEKARALGARILEAERDLEHAFAERRIDPPSLRSRLAAIAVLQGELRAVHLETHLAQRALLAPEQIARYDALRGYRPAGHRQHSR